MTAKRIAKTSLSDDTPANLLLFERLYTVLLTWIIACAQRISDGDRDLQDDIMQVGLQTLWELCASDVTTLDPNVVRGQVHLAMLKFEHAERNARILVPAWVRQHDDCERTRRHAERPYAAHTVHPRDNACAPLDPAVNDA